MAKKQKKGSRKQEEEFDLPEGLDLLESNGWGKKMIDWLKANFSAIILPIIALIILGGGIYLYSQQKTQDLDINEGDLKTGITIDLEDEESTEDTVPAEETKDSEAVGVDEEKQDTSIEIAQAEPEEGEGGPIKEPAVTTQPTAEYKQAAQKGDGITHLARRIIKQRLQEQKTDLSPEQKIYAEDYVQNRTGTRMLEVGEEITFSRLLVDEAISKAKDLTPAQLENLAQYARLVPSL